MRRKRIAARSSSSPTRPATGRSLAQSLFDQEKYPEAAAEYQKLGGCEPDDANNHLRLAEIYRPLQQFDKAEQEVLLAKKQRSRATWKCSTTRLSIYEAEERYDDAIRVLSDAVAGVKAQAEVTPARRRTLAILYQLLGNSTRTSKTIPRRSIRFGRWSSWARKRTGAEGC